MKIGFLWFGAWKNAQCSYAPAWVKTDLSRFRRAQMVKGENNAKVARYHDLPYTSLSYLCQETRQADARAFAALMRHLQQVDSEEQTVIWMQVENETGVMGEAREMSEEADTAFAGEVLPAFVQYMREHSGTMVPDVKEAVERGRSSGSWEDVFGPCAGEIFSAYHIASYVNAVAEAGSAEYRLPLSVNCWLDQGGEPGAYPSGGPVRRMMEVWQFCAPAIDVIAPDIYVPNFCEICDRYTELGNPLMIPETATHSYCAPRLVYAIGHYHALCCSPFGFEDLGEPFGAHAGFLFGMDVTDPALKTPQNAEEYGWYARTLNSMAPVLTGLYGTDRLQAVNSKCGSDAMVFGGFGFRARMDKQASMMFGGRQDGVCLIAQASEDTFYALLHGCLLQFYSADPKKPAIDILDLEEGYFEDGQWRMTRRRNGDEAALMGFEKPSLLRIRLFAYR